MICASSLVSLLNIKRAKAQVSEILREKGLVLATKNQHKIREMRSLLAPLQLKIHTLDSLQDEKGEPLVSSSYNVEETGSDFQTNARIKAQSCFDTTGYISLADDSGLIVDALGGAPGVHSARYGGKGLNDNDRVLYLLEQMQKLESKLESKFDSKIGAKLAPIKRNARYFCVLALATKKSEHSDNILDPSCYFFEASCEGYIAESLDQSHCNGFGYDPIFIDVKLNKSFAELTSVTKNTRSHRAKASQKLIKYIQNILV